MGDDGGDGPRQGVWRDGDHLVFSYRAPLPDRCIRCGGPAGGWRFERALRWHPPAYYLAVLVPVLYLGVALFVQRSERIRVGLCPEHRRDRRRRVALCGAVLGLGAGLLGASFAAEHPWLWAAGLLVLSIGWAATLHAWRMVYPRRMARGYTWLSGTSPEFLAPLPEWS